MPKLSEVTAQSQPMKLSQVVAGNANDSDFGRMVSGAPAPAQPEAGFLDRLGFAAKGELEGLKQGALGMGQTALQGGPGGIVGRKIAEALGVDMSGARDLAARGSEAVGGFAGDSRRAFDQTAAGQSGEGQGGVIVGQVAPAFAIPGGGANLLTRGAVAGLGGVAQSALDPVEGGNYADEKGKQAALLGSLGVAGQTGAAAVGKLAEKSQRVLDPAFKKSVELLDRLGIPVHLSQAMDSGFLKLVSSVANKLPFSGVKEAGRKQQVAVDRELGKMIGMDGVTSLNESVIEQATKKISNGYNALFARNSVKITPQTKADLDAIRAKVATDIEPGPKQQVVLSQIDKFINASRSGVLNGRLYQNLRESLRQPEKNQEYGYLVGEVRKAMEAAANRSFGPEDAAMLKRLNGMYGNKKIIEKALQQVAGASDHVNPSSLWALVRTKYKSTPEMRQFAKAGQNVLKNPIPDSGTSGREMVNRMMGFGGATAAGTAAYAGLLPQLAAMVGTGATAGRLLNSPMAGRIIPGAGGKVANVAAQGAQALPVGLPAMMRAWKLKQDEEARQRAAGQP